MRGQIDVEGLGKERRKEDGVDRFQKHAHVSCDLSIEYTGLPVSHLFRGGGASEVLDDMTDFNDEQ